MRLPLLFARRYLFSRKSTNAINVITAVSMTGIMVCSAAFLIILSVFNGFEGLVTDLYKNFYSDIRIVPDSGKVFVPHAAMRAKIAAFPDVAHISEVLEENALAVYDQQQQPVRIKGVDENFVHVSGLDTSMAYGDTFLLQDGQRQYCIVGSGIDQAIQVANLKDPLHQISFFVPSRDKGRSLLPTGEFERDALPVWGVFVIQDDFDNKYVFTPISFIRDLLEFDNEVSAIEIALQPGAPLQQTAEAIQEAIGSDYRVLTRYRQNALLYQVMNAERLVVYLILSFVLVIVAFNMIGSLSMIVIEKRKDISVLQAMGATPNLVRYIFFTEGLLQTLLSLAVGFLIATTLILVQQWFGIIPIQGSGTFIVQYYPVAIRPMDYVWVALIVLCIGALASWIPAARASRQFALKDLQ